MSATVTIKKFPQPFMYNMDDAVNVLHTPREGVGEIRSWTHVDPDTKCLKDWGIYYVQASILMWCGLLLQSGQVMSKGDRSRGVMCAMCLKRIPPEITLPLPFW